MIHQHSSIEIGRFVKVATLASAALLVAACSSGRDDNFDRSDLFTELTSEADRSAPSDVAGLDGSATFSGVAIAAFSGPDAGEDAETFGFAGTANATLRADFTDQTIEGEMTGWTDTSPETHELRGTLRLSNGSIAGDGSFSADLAGNIERSLAGPDGDNPAFLDVYAGSADGQIYDSIDGSVAQIAEGTFSGSGLSTSVEGAFIASQ